MAQPAFEHLHQQGVSGQVGGHTARWRVITFSIGTSTSRPAATTRPQVAVGEDAKAAVGQPDQRIGDVVFGHLHHRIAHRGVGRDQQHVAVHQFGDRPAVGGRCNRRPVGSAHVPRRRRQERQPRRLGEPPAPTSPAT